MNGTLLAYPEGFEPPPAVLETVVLPLNTKGILIGSDEGIRTLEP
jgi:hypothetical protein